MNKPLLLIGLSFFFSLLLVNSAFSQIVPANDSSAKVYKGNIHPFLTGSDVLIIGSEITPTEYLAIGAYDNLNSSDAGSYQNNPFFRFNYTVSGSGDILIKWFGFDTGVLGGNSLFLWNFTNST
jgi:hypothetical protein